MRMLLLLTSLLLLSACVAGPVVVSTQPAFESTQEEEYEPYLSFAVLNEDRGNLPQIASELDISEVEVGDSMGCDALLISDSLLYKAEEDPVLKDWLVSTAFDTVVVVYGATTRDLAEVLELNSPIVDPEEGKQEFVGIRASKNPDKIVATALLVSSGNQVSAEELENFVQDIDAQIY
jgi:hypothetical protein